MRTILKMCFCFLILFTLQGKAQSNCDTSFLSFNTGIDHNTGQFYHVDQQDLFWQVTNVTNFQQTSGYNLPYPAFVTQRNPAWAANTNIDNDSSSYLTFLPSTFNEMYLSNVYTVELTRNFTTTQDDNFNLNLFASADNYICYIKVDGVVHYTPPNVNIYSFQTFTHVLNDYSLFLNQGCHNIQVAYANQSGTPQGVNIYGGISSQSNINSLLKPNCDKYVQLSATNTVNVCSNCEVLWPNLMLNVANECNLIDTVKVQITNGYTSGQDVLQCVNNFGITSSFNTNTGTLLLYGQAISNNWQIVLRTICYKSLVNNANNNFDTKDVVIQIGNAIYNPVNGHFYKRINTSALVTWYHANSNASSTNYYGYKGYLATITDITENNLLQNLSPTYTWIGASDALQEGNWRWVTGCEGQEDFNTGRLFSTQQLGSCAANTNSSVNGNFTDWINTPTTTPNCLEDYAYIITNNNNPAQGTWNHSNNYNSLIKSYWIEYGCLPLNNTIQLLGNAQVHLKLPNDTIINKTICQGANYLGYSNAGIYTINTFNNINGCDSTVILNLSIQNNISPSFTQLPAICSGATVSTLPTTSNNGITGTWNISAINNTQTQTYTFTPTSNSCANTTTMQVVVLDLPVLTANNASICAGASTTLTASGADTYNWLPTNTLNIANSATVLATPLATQVYTVIGTDINGCVGYTTIFVNVLQNAIPVFSPLPTICSGATVSTLPTTSNNGITGTWNISAINNTQTQTYTFTPTSNSCANTTTMQVVVLDLPVLTANNASICAGASTTLTASGADTYNWLPTNSLNTANSATVLATPLATQVYTISGTDINGCVGNTTLTLSIHTPILFNTVDVKNPSCYNSNNGSIFLNANGGVGSLNYYMNNVPYNNEVTLNNISSGTFSIVITDAMGCQVDTTLYITPQSNFTFTLNEQNSTMCVNEKIGTLLLNATGGTPNYNYIIEPLYINNTTGVFNNLGVGVYTVIVVDANGCSSLQSINFGINYNAMLMSAQVNSVTCNSNVSDGSIVLNVSGGNAPYHYYFNGSTQQSTSNYYSNLNAGFYTASVVDDNGCVLSDTFEIKGATCCVDVSLPNAFSPNNDGVNDLYRPYAANVLDVMEYVIYNRWGQLVFSSNNSLQGWDGYTNGIAADAGVYYILFKYKCGYDNKEYFLKQDISLVR